MKTRPPRPIRIPVQKQVELIRALANRAGVVKLSNAAFRYLWEYFVDLIRGLLYTTFELQRPYSKDSAPSSLDPVVLREAAKAMNFKTCYRHADHLDLNAEESDYNPSEESEEEEEDDDDSDRGSYTGVNEDAAGSSPQRNDNDGEKVGAKDKKSTANAKNQLPAQMLVSFENTDFGKNVNGNTDPAKNVTMSITVSSDQLFQILREKTEKEAAAALMRLTQETKEGQEGENKRKALSDNSWTAKKKPATGNKG